MLTEPTIQKAVREAKRDGKVKTLSDGSGKGTGRLVLMIRPPSTIEWYDQRWTNGKKQLRKIGRFPDVSLADARALFRHGVAQAKPEPTSGSIGQLFEDYVAHLELQGKRSAPNIRDTLKRVSKAIGNKPANQVTTADVIACLRPIYADGKASMADHMRGAIRSAYGWAIKAQNDYRTTVRDKFHLTTNPAANIPTEPKLPGERWLSIEELRTFWGWLSKGNPETPWHRVTDPRNYTLLKILILTGQRVEEVARLHTSMVNLQERFIEWPETKNGRAHVLPIPIQVVRWLSAIRANEHGLYFPACHHPDRPLIDQTLRVITRRFCKESGLPHFTPRDLRRTWKTLAGQAGISKSARDLLQNHTATDVSSRHYDRYDYLPEKRQAMDQWSEWILTRIKKPA